VSNGSGPRLPLGQLRDPTPAPRDTTEPQYPLHRRLGGLWNLFRHFGEEKTLFPLLGCEFQTIQPMA